jgi:hypothetical protein
MVRGESVSYQCRDWGGRVVSVQQVRERLSAACAHTPETAERGLDLKMKFLTDGPPSSIPDRPDYENWSLSYYRNSVDICVMST